MLLSNEFILDGSTILSLPPIVTTPIQYAADILKRDQRKVFGEVAESKVGSTINVRFAKEGDSVFGQTEVYAIEFKQENDKDLLTLEVVGSDELGIIYGLLHLTEKYMGVEPFWFWQEKEPEKKASVSIPAVEYVSPEHKVRFRGWFVNDEVCLIGWTETYPPPKEVWFPVFEALLRCGGNMVIPGTDLPRSGVHWKLASDMGLYRTFHHAEPLGAEMFCRAYPDKTANYNDFPELFESLWEESVQKQKDLKVVWVLGFRGQGDCPFWEQDKSYDTPEKRGEHISKIIKRQHDIVCRHVTNPVFCTSIYGEITALYKSGFIDLPEDVIKIWADNGFGKMVSRRQWNDNPRIPSLPGKGDKGPHGIYYHITFHDLQASNHLTMFPSHPELVRDELTRSFESGADQYLLLNCGNIRPHVYFLEIVSKMWNQGELNIEQHLDDFCRRFYPSKWETIKECYRGFFESTIKYGENEDDKAGDEFYHHAARSFATKWMMGETDKTDDYLLWATGNIGFKEQIIWFRDKLKFALRNWQNLMEKAERVLNELDGDEKNRFAGTVYLQIKFNYYGCRGFWNLCRSYIEYSEGRFPYSFVLASESLWDYRENQKALDDAEFGMWKNFYRDDYLTNVKGTIYCVEALRRFIRMHGDSPDFFWWFRQHIVPESERIVLLENTTRRMLPDDELALRLKESLKW